MRIWASEKPNMRTLYKHISLKLMIEFINLP